MDYVAYFLLAKVAIFQGFVYSDVINLSLPKYAIDGEDIWVKCSSDIVPYEQIAEFLVNGVTTDTIRRYNNDCFSSITRTVCSTDVCNCSSDGKSYSTNLFANNQIGNVTITCSMKLKRNGEVFKTEHVYISLLESTTHKEYITSSFLKDIHNQLSTKPLTTGSTTGFYNDSLTRTYNYVDLHQVNRLLHYDKHCTSEYQ
ncbi:unnamed protein product [Mytilus coruscus]|uniref:Uncharacterized protein n=1 Tax=Mytilus coruscus TaxID=42192 RepID=A0A6J8CPT3_MYTCO|nr:unnamed protein product [Mytilus coruscus]